MRRKIPALLLSSLLVACGSSPDKGAGKNPKGKGPGGGDQGQSSCPADVPSAFHRITLKFSRPLPAHLGLKLDTDKDVRFSECANLKQTAPAVVVSRHSGSNDLTVEVVHNGFYNPLPREVTFDLLDLGNCGSSIQPFYSLRAHPLFWKIEFPNGPTCAGRAEAIAEVIPGLE